MEQQTQDLFNNKIKTMMQTVQNLDQIIRFFYFLKKHLQTFFDEH